MRTMHIRILVILGTVLALTQVLGIPLSWKQWLSGLIGIFFIGWALYLRYAAKSLHREDPHE